ncbi:MAG TPA: xylulokinase [Bacillota bacterium]|nr:xylulokinase [Clostridiales bacterium]HPT85342.1 xylulokinase [Bacillota bacterium]
MAYLIGVDIGTSGTKTVLFDEAGRTVADALYEYPLYQPKAGWAEQDPIDWWVATYESISDVIAKSGVNPDDIKGVGLSGQMHGLVMLDAAGNVLRRSIIWCDQRTSEECAEITELVGKEKLIEITANPALTGFTASKIMWVKKHEPEIFEKCRKILLPKDYIRYMLTGEFATEVSDASGMQLLDVPARNWSRYVLDKLGIDIGMLGKVYESCEVTGQITESAAKLTGLRPGTPVVGGAGDQAASAVGCGIVREGVASVTIGTSGVVFAHTDSIKIDPLGRVHTFCHAVPGAWHVMGVTQGAGLSFKWMRDNFFAAEKLTAAQTGDDPNYVMDQIAKNSPVGAGGIIYLPYLMGERTPHLDPFARGVFFGLSAIHEKRDLLRAVLEGVVFSLCDCMDILREMGINPTSVYAAGGGGNSKLWRQMLADAFGMSISVSSSKQGGALGVAILAGVGAGVYKSVPEACDAIVSEASRTEPIAENTAKYAKIHKFYKKLYADLREDFAELAKIMES